jgi:hypothetical protein
MQLKISFSSDQTKCRLEFASPANTPTIMNAQQLESLISQLANARAKLAPRTHQSETPLSRPSPLVDVISPRMDCALVAEQESLVVLSIAYPGLGWRSIAVTPDEAQTFGRRLLTMGATQS